MNWVTLKIWRIVQAGRWYKLRRTHGRGTGRALVEGLKQLTVEMLSENGPMRLASDGQKLLGALAHLG